MVLSAAIFDVEETREDDSKLLWLDMNDVQNDQDKWAKTADSDHDGLGFLTKFSTRKIGNLKLQWISITRIIN